MASPNPVSSNPVSNDPMAVKVYAPDSNEPTLTTTTFPYDGFMGTWHVVASTLPLWKNKKNVRITYTPLVEGANAGTWPNRPFLDTVEYNSEKDAPGKPPSKIVGEDHIELMGQGGSGARWKWRGRGLLMIASSHWQVLGYHVSGTDVDGDLGPEDWAVTYFSKTLFTPAGLDVYVRHPGTFTEEKIDAIIEACKNSTEAEVKRISQGFFKIKKD